MARNEEGISLMEPLVIPEGSASRSDLQDLVVELSKESASLKSALPQALQESLASMVRAMNCYYSNLIEDHNTHPIDIERALKGNYDTDTKKRDLQLEAKAHIKVQEWVDEGGLGNDPFATGAICSIHRRFCEQLPEDLLWVIDPETNEKIRLIPGELRKRDVIVGRHVAVSPGAIPKFLERYESVYSKLGKFEMILALAASHHRLLWIHPFLDGNGRVARLLSHAVILKILDAGSIWSISRGLARNVTEYKEHLANCDLQRRNDLDGRGNLSQETLVSFTRFFLKICIDQVAFMRQLMEPERLRARMILWAKEEIEIGNIPEQSIPLFEVILHKGEISRGAVSGLFNVTDRHARRLVSPLIEKDILISDSPKSPLRLAFPAKYAHRWMPGLFPESSG